MRAARRLALRSSRSSRVSFLVDSFVRSRVSVDGGGARDLDVDLDFFLR